MSETENENKASKKSRIIWVVILFVYLALFASTGYISFIAEDFNPTLKEIDLDKLNFLGDNQDKTKLITNMINTANEIYKKKRELAHQSFSVVLGALLGFLSASAASRIGKQDP